MAGASVVGVAALRVVDGGGEADNNCIPNQTQRTKSHPSQVLNVQQAHDASRLPAFFSNLISTQVNATSKQGSKQMKRLGLASLLMAALLLLLLVVASPAAALAKKRKAWTEKELEALEKQWEDGDAEEDLDSPHRRHRLEMEEAEKARKEGWVGAVNASGTGRGGGRRQIHVPGIAPYCSRQWSGLGQ